MVSCMDHGEESPEPHIDASTFQQPLGRLAEVLAQKVKREAPKLLAAPDYVTIDMNVLIRQAMSTYDLLFYINADERRENDCYWKPIYTIVTAPLVRSMIDCLYNITAILQDPNAKGPAFRKSGFKKALRDLEDDEERYGGDLKWDGWLKQCHKKIDYAIRAVDLDIADVHEQSPWPTLGKYISDKNEGGTLTAHQEFLKTFTYGMWREYSA
jgi:hypothetical protein